jgi:hypothetical protein
MIRFSNLYNMRTLVFTIILLVMASAIAWQCKEPFTITRGNDRVVPLRDSVQGVLKNMPDPGFSRNELVVFFREQPTRETIDAIKQRMRDKGIDPDAISIKTCNACSATIQLWQAPDIYTYVMAEGVRSGSGGGGSNGVGEDSLARYSLNFRSQLPVDSLVGVGASLVNYNRQSYPVNDLAGKSIVRIAVLDTGVDTAQFIHPSYLWTNERERRDRKDEDANCYTDDVAGWNFLNNDAEFDDNNINIHGTLVTKYIIDQFRASTTQGVQIMALKTHDATGAGNLFASICAIYYAIENQANIINASWGFYNFGANPVPFLDSLVTQVLPRNGILFVTAAGNKVDAFDSHARRVYRAMHGTDISAAGLRNLEIHNFYPALFSRAGNNVITTTTTDAVRVSPTQNYSALYVDLGVLADQVTTTSMKFIVPFSISATPQYISGSSFATAIACGKIGAQFKRSLYAPGISKDNVFTEMGGTIRRSAPLGLNSLIRGGRYIAR